MMRSISIEVIPPKAMRYKTVGDWVFVDGALKITVADMGDWRYNVLVGIHELIEVVICTFKGITEKQVDKFDFAHQDDEDPGSHPKCPCHDQHMVAMGIEMILSVLLGVKWRTYEAAIEKAWRKTPKRKK